MRWAAAHQQVLWQSPASWGLKLLFENTFIGLPSSWFSLGFYCDPSVPTVCSAPAVVTNLERIGGYFCLSVRSQVFYLKPWDCSHSCDLWALSTMRGSRRGSCVRGQFRGRVCPLAAAHQSEPAQISLTDCVLLLLPRFFSPCIPGSGWWQRGLGKQADQQALFSP